ncbi:MAG TPA: chaperone modulator CbpM [Neisseria sp.]|jgi:chaperone modulatory protein CbpM|uniref:chaperone modulator CbpM n=1 Tax=Uruburuella suis TaxID=252130 RepID=UPI002490908B|nr:chaperone modulator CbpM [Uruburuella suis]HRM21422.1 chaperone modulator CbpM [Neisseria sp.]
MNQEYDVQLSFEELVHACDNDRQWVVSLIEENAISISGEPHLATFSGYQLARVRRARRLHRDFDASAAAAALILELLDELEELRKLNN